MRGRSRSEGPRCWLGLTGRFWQWAELALGEAFGRNSKSAVEAGAVILPTDDCREFDKLPLGEVRAQSGVEFVGDVGGGACKRRGQTEHCFFAVVEMGAGFELR